MKLPNERFPDRILRKSADSLCLAAWSPLRRLQPGRVAGRLGWVLLLFAGYAASYFLVRVRSIDAAGSPDIHCTSRTSQFLFAPLIKMEQTFRGPWQAHRSIEDEKQRFEEILRLAKNTHRNVLFTVGTTSCLPCRQLEQFLKEQESILSRYILVAKVNVDDAKGNGEALHQRYRQEKGTSAKFHYFPWMAILDGDGKILVSGDDGPPGTIGIPHGGPADREWFLKMLKVAAPEISDEELRELDSGALRFHQRIWEGQNPRN